MQDYLNDKYSFNGVTELTLRLVFNRVTTIKFSPINTWTAVKRNLCQKARKVNPDDDGCLSTFSVPHVSVKAFHRLKDKSFDVYFSSNLDGY